MKVKEFLGRARLLIVLAILVIPSIPFVRAQTPTITVQPNGGYWGQMVYVTGNGFAGRKPYFLHFRRILGCFGGRYKC